MDIFVNALSARDGGGITFINALIGSMAKLDYSIQYLVFVSSKIASEFNPIKSLVNVKVIPVKRGKLSTIHRLCWEQFILPRLVTKNHNALLLSPANIATFFWRGPQVLVVQSIAPFRWEAQQGKGAYNYLRYLVLNLLTRLSFRIADVVVVNSNITRSIVLQNGCFPGKVRIIPMGRSEVFSGHSINEVVIDDPEGKYILTVGSISRHKNLETLIKAISELRNKGHTWPLKIVGLIADSRYHAYLKALAANLGIVNSIDFVGPIPNEQLPTIYASAGVFVLTSKVEGFSIPLVEAMSMGCPVVSGKQITTREVCGDAALECDVYDPSDVALKIERVMTHIDLRAQMRAYSLARAKDLDWSKLAKEYLTIFKQLSRT